MTWLAARSSSSTSSSEEEEEDEEEEEEDEEAGGGGAVSLGFLRAVFFGFPLLCDGAAEVVAGVRGGSGADAVQSVSTVLRDDGVGR